MKYLKVEHTLQFSLLSSSTSSVIVQANKPLKWVENELYSSSSHFVEWCLWGQGHSPGPVRVQDSSASVFITFHFLNLQHPAGRRKHWKEHEVRAGGQFRKGLPVFLTPCSHVARSNCKGECRNEELLLCPDTSKECSLLVGRQNWSHCWAISKMELFKDGLICSQDSIQNHFKEVWSSFMTP